MRQYPHPAPRLPAAAELAPDAAAPDRRATSRVSLDVDRSVHAG